MIESFPKILLTAPGGAQAVISLYGAHVTSWITPDGRERLFMSQRADFRPGAALRGGVPVIFPQFSGMGPLPKHGFARTSMWGPLGTRHESPGTATARFCLRDSDETCALWDHRFRLDLAVTVGGPRLEIGLQVANPGAQPFTFTAALHTYLRVDDIDAVTIAGLEGRAYREYGVDGVQDAAPLRIVGEVDRIYWQVPGPIVLHDGGHTVQVTASGFPDAVIWNPGPEKADALADMEPDGYRHMVCIEAAVIGNPVTLASGGVWHGSQALLI